MKASTKRKIKQILSIFTRIGLKNKDFSIISNNCWGGWYYDRYHLSYLTPPIGLFFPAKDYLKFLSNIHHYLDDCELEKISFDDSKYQELLLDKAELDCSYKLRRILDDNFGTDSVLEMMQKTHSNMEMAEKIDDWLRYMKK